MNNQENTLLDKKKIDKLGDEVNFNNKLNNMLDNAVLKLYPDMINRDDNIKPLVDFYQIAENWLKLRFIKSKKTWTITKETFISGVSSLLLKPLSDSDLKTAESVVSSKASKLGSNKELDNIKIQVKLGNWDNDVTLSKEDVTIICTQIWDRLASTSWSSALEDKITDQNFSRDVYNSVIRPFKQNGEQCNPDEFVVVTKPVRSCWYTNGEYIPSSSTQLWYRAIDPISWFGQPANEKPKTLTSYDDPKVSLEAPTQSLKDATLKEDEAFGYAK